MELRCDSSRFSYTGEYFPGSVYIHSPLALGAVVHVCVCCKDLPIGPRGGVICSDLARRHTDGTPQ